MFSARSSEVLLALLVLPHFQPLLPVRVCLLLVSRDANTWTTKSPMGTTHLLGALVFCWLPPQIKPDWISHLVCSNESAILSMVGLLLQQTGTGSLCSWKLTGHTHTQWQKVMYHSTQSTSDKCFSKGTGMGHICVPQLQLTLPQNNLKLLSEGQLGKLNFWDFLTSFFRYYLTRCSDALAITFPLSRYKVWLVENPRQSYTLNYNNLIQPVHLCIAATWPFASCLCQKLCGLHLTLVMYFCFLSIKRATLSWLNNRNWAKQQTKKWFSR